MLIGGRSVKTRDQLGVHFVGSVRLADPETVFRATCTPLGLSKDRQLLSSVITRSLPLPI